MSPLPGGRSAPAAHLRSSGRGPRRDWTVHLSAGVRLISQLCGYVAAALIALGVVVVCHMVFVRYVLNQNTIWQTDFVTYSLVAATFVGSPYVLMTRGHVNVDVLPHYLGPRARWWLALFAAAVTLAFCVTIAVLTFQFWKRGLGQPLGVRHHVAGAPVDSLRVDADRPRHPHPAVPRRPARPGQRPRAAVRHRRESARS